MFQRLINQSRRFLLKPVPEKSIQDLKGSLFWIILIFFVFYFAGFDYSVSRQHLIRGVVEYFLVALALLVSFASIVLGMMLVAKLVKSPIRVTFGGLIAGFFVLYSVAMGILYPVKGAIWNIQKAWFWKYYWRHLPYATLIFAVVLYREVKNAYIQDLVESVNARLGEKSELAEKNIPAQRSETPLKIMVDGTERTFAPPSISHVSVNGHYLDLFYSVEERQDQVCFRQPLQDFLSKCPSDRFIRVHRSHIVNIDRIVRLTRKKRQYSIILNDDPVSIPIGRSYLKSVLDILREKAPTVM